MSSAAGSLRTLGPSPESSWYPKAPLVVEFHTDGDGSAVALTFTGMFYERERLERIVDLPERR